MRQSFTACRGLKLVNRLAGYTVGHCVEEEKSEWRTLRALNYWKGHPFVEPVVEPAATQTPVAVAAPKKT